MPNDRELLELAAKAIHLPENYENAPFMRGFYSNWNPLTDDGDALRLAVKLKMIVGITQNGCWAEISGEEPAYEVADYRRAIVRAAAEIGRGMP